MPSILFFPLLPFVFEVGLVIYWVAVTGGPAWLQADTLPTLGQKSASSGPASSPQSAQQASSHIHRCSSRSIMPRTVIRPACSCAVQRRRPHCQLAACGRLPAPVL